jgi:hypothetical protein
VAVAIGLQAGQTVVLADLHQAVPSSTNTNIARRLTGGAVGGGGGGGLAGGLTGG